MENYKITFGKHKGTLLSDMTSYEDRKYCQWLFDKMEENEQFSDPKYSKFKEHLENIKAQEAIGKALITDKRVSPSKYNSKVDYYEISMKYAEEMRIRKILKQIRSEQRTDVPCQGKKEPMDDLSNTILELIIRNWDYATKGIITESKIGCKLIKGNWAEHKARVDRKNELYRNNLKRAIKNLYKG